MSDGFAYSIFWYWDKILIKDGTNFKKAAPIKAKDGIIAGTVHPFTGPIKDQSGKIVIPAGKTADDGMLLGMNFYVEGVDGTIPK